MFNSFLFILTRFIENNQKVLLPFPGFVLFSVKRSFVGLQKGKLLPGQSVASQHISLVLINFVKFYRQCCRVINHRRLLKIEHKKASFSSGAIRETLERLTQLHFETFQKPNVRRLFYFKTVPLPRVYIDSCHQRLRKVIVNTLLCSSCDRKGRCAIYY